MYQKMHEKILSFTVHQGNANQNHSELSLHMSVRLSSKGQVRSAGESVERGARVLCRWERELVQSLCKTAWRFLKRLNQNCCTTLRLHF